MVNLFYIMAIFLYINAIAKRLFVHSCIIDNIIPLHTYILQNVEDYHQYKILHSFLVLFI